jgi:RNA polymerase sigma-70 factor (ECF subfamily)
MVDPSEMTGAQAAQLIEAIALRRDRDAFAALFNFLAPRLKRQCARFGCPPDVADDLAQDTFVLVWRKAAQFDPARGDPFAWIFRINANLRVDLARRNARANRVNALDEASAAEAGVAPSEPNAAAAESGFDRTGLSAALALLPTSQQEVVELSYYREVPHAEIARRLGIPLGTVKSRLRLAMSRLKRAMGEAE